jgi:hypothetical protein
LSEEEKETNAVSLCNEIFVFSPSGPAETSCPTTCPATARVCPSPKRTNGLKSRNGSPTSAQPSCASDCYSPPFSPAWSILSETTRTAATGALSTMTPSVKLLLRIRLLPRHLANACTEAFKSSCHPYCIGTHLLQAIETYNVPTDDTSSMNVQAKFERQLSSFPGITSTASYKKIETWVKET